MEVQNFVFLGTLVILTIVCSPVAGASRFRRQAQVGANMTLSINATLVNQTLQAIQNLLNATAQLPIQLQQQILSALNNGTNITLQALQNVQNLIQQAAGNLTLHQQQLLQNITAALANLTQNGVLPILKQLAGNVTNLFQNATQLLNILQLLQSGLQNLTQQGGQIGAAAQNLLAQLNAGNLTNILVGAIGNITGTVDQQFQQLLAYLQSFGNSLGQAFATSIRDLLSFLNSAVQIIFPPIVGLPLSLLQSLFGFFG